jgi:hypothetical protein
VALLPVISSPKQTTVFSAPLFCLAEFPGFREELKARWRCFICVLFAKCRVDETSGSEGGEYEDDWLHPGLLGHVVWWKFTDVSEVLVASIIRALKCW